MDDTPSQKLSRTVTIGEDFYGFSVVDLEERLGVLKAEIDRVEKELVKKQRDRQDADKLFGG